MRYSATLLIALASCWSTNSEAAEVHSIHCVWGCPTGAATSNDLIFRLPYTLSSNDETKYADWVAYRITFSTIGKGRIEGFSRDPLLDDDETLGDDAYSGHISGARTDRGHQAPSAALINSADAPSLNLLSNVTPQRSALNQGAWEDLEERVRLFVRDGKASVLFVLTGPLFDGNVAEPRELTSGALLPTAYWKVIARPAFNNASEIIGIQTASFIMHQDLPRDADFCGQQASIDQIEDRSGLDLFPFAPGDDFESEAGFGNLTMELGCPHAPA